MGVVVQGLQAFSQTREDAMPSTADIRQSREADPVRRQLAARGGDWRRLDFEDVAISLPALRAVKETAKEILAGLAPVSLHKGLTVGDAVAVMTRHVFWERGSGRLTMCAEVAGRAVCMGIPAGHWRLRGQGATN